MSFEHFERGYLLPKGCKDLVDVIKMQALRKPSICLKPASSSGGEAAIINDELFVFAPVTAAELAAALKQKPFKIVADLMQLGVFAAVNQCLDFDTVSQVARRYGYVAEKLG